MITWVAFGGFILGAAFMAVGVLLAGRGGRGGYGQIYREPKRWRAP